MEVGNQSVMMLAVWPETAAENWIMQLQELNAGVTQDDALKSVDQLFEEFQAKVEAYALPVQFEHMAVTADARSVMDEANRWQPKEGWTLAHLETGFKGTQLQGYSDAWPILQDDELIRLIALARMYGTAALSKL
jgi:hypothetical protein